MVDQNAGANNPRAVKFQRLLFGVFLLVAFVFNWLPLVILVAMLMLLFAFLPMRFSPFYRLYLFFGQSVEGCMCSNGETSFACGVGGFVLAIAIYLYSVGISTVAWVLILLVAAMSLLAGTTGFCLGSLIYAWLKRKF